MPVTLQPVGRRSTAPLCLGLALVPLIACASPGAASNMTFDQHMAQARELADDGRNFVLIVEPAADSAAREGGVYVFYNSPDPFSYAYTIPGSWTESDEPNLYVSEDGQRMAGVMFFTAEGLGGSAGESLVQLTAELLAEQHERAVGRPPAGSRLAPFSSSKSGTWKWDYAPVRQGDQLLEPATKILVDLSPHTVVQITVLGTPDDEQLAREIIDSLRITTEPSGYWAATQGLLEVLHGES